MITYYSPFLKGNTWVANPKPNNISYPWPTGPLDGPALGAQYDVCFFPGVYLLGCVGDVTPWIGKATRTGPKCQVIFGHGSLYVIPPSCRYSRSCSSPPRIIGGCDRISGLSEHIHCAVECHFQGKVHNLTSFQ